MSYYDYPPEYDLPDYTLLRQKLVVARKAQTCVHRHPIPIGTVYERHVYVEEGEFKSEATCLECIRSYLE